MNMFIKLIKECCAKAALAVTVGVLFGFPSGSGFIGYGSPIVFGLNFLPALFMAENTRKGTY